MLPITWRPILACNGTTMLPMVRSRSQSSSLWLDTSHSSTGSWAPGFHGALKSISILKQSFQKMFNFDNYSTIKRHQELSGIVKSSRAQSRNTLRLPASDSCIAAGPQKFQNSSCGSGKNLKAAIGQIQGCPGDWQTSRPAFLQRSWNRQTASRLNLSLGTGLWRCKLESLGIPASWTAERTHSPTTGLS